jgi:uncharacterized protein YciI
MHYVLFYDFVDSFLQKRTQYRRAHLERVRDAFERGELVLAGALADPTDRGVLIFRGTPPGAAEGFAKTDPYVVNGLVTSWSVRKWVTVIGEGSTPP